MPLSVFRAVVFIADWWEIIYNIEQALWIKSFEICVGGLHRFYLRKGIFRVLCLDMKMRLSFKDFTRNRE